MATVSRRWLNEDWVQAFWDEILGIRRQTNNRFDWMQSQLALFGEI